MQRVYLCSMWGRPQTRVLRHMQRARFAPNALERTCPMFLSLPTWWARCHRLDGVVGSRARASCSFQHSGRRGISGRARRAWLTSDGCWTDIFCYYAKVLSRPRCPKRQFHHVHGLRWCLFTHDTQTIRDPTPRLHAARRTTTAPCPRLAVIHRNNRPKPGPRAEIVFVARSLLTKARPLVLRLTHRRDQLHAPSDARPRRQGTYPSSQRADPALKEVRLRHHALAFTCRRSDSYGEYGCRVLVEVGDGGAFASSKKQSSTWSIK